MTDNRFRINTGIDKTVRQRYLAKTDVWCEAGSGKLDGECHEYRHYVRCTEHEFCHCTGDTLILICEMCWSKALSELRRKKYQAEPLPELRSVRNPALEALHEARQKLDG